MTSSTAPVRTQADLERLWRTLMEPLGFSTHTLWIFRIAADDRPEPRIVEIADVEPELQAEDAAQLASLLHGLDTDVETTLGPGSRWAFLLSRPGGGGVVRADRTRAAVLLGACRRAGLVTEVLHVATDDVLVPLPFDELASLPASA